MTRYVGPSGAKGTIRLYPSVKNLTRFIEILEKDIVHYEKVPETEVSHDAVLVWVKKDADIRHQISNTFSANQFLNIKKNIIKKGRLQMRLGKGFGGVNSTVCQSICNITACQSVCFGQCSSDCSQQCTNPCTSVCVSDSNNRDFFKKPK